VPSGRNDAERRRRVTPEREVEGSGAAPDGAPFHPTNVGPRTRALGRGHSDAGGSSLAGAPRGSAARRKRSFPCLSESAILALQLGDSVYPIRSTNGSNRVQFHRVPFRGSVLTPKRAARNERNGGRVDVLLSRCFTGGARRQWSESWGRGSWGQRVGAAGSTMRGRNDDGRRVTGRVRMGSLPRENECASEA
jgi:hypothetical protein